MDLTQYVRENPTMSPTIIAKAFGVSRQAVYQAKKRIREDSTDHAPMGDMASLPAPPPPAVVIPEDPTARRNWLRTEEGKNALAEVIGGKLRIALDAMTPEKAAKTSFKDLSISAGVLTDKLQKINDNTAAGVGMLAVALVKAVSSQMQTLRALAPPVPVEFEVVE